MHGQHGHDALAWVLAGVLVLVLGGGSRDASAEPPQHDATTACEGNRPDTGSLFFELRSGAFPGSGRPDVAVHVPPGFDATRLPSVVVYFHGWNGCVATALADDDAPCTEGGALRPASGLARQLDDARVNAVLVAIELRADAPTGDVGQLANQGGLHELLSEVFAEHLIDPLGCTLEIGRLDRVVVVAHSGGYQAAAAVVARGEVPVTELALLDAYYGADEVFRGWATDALDPIDPSEEERRFVDLYTCCAGTLDRSRALSVELGARQAAAAEGISTVFFDEDTGDLTDESLEARVVVARVPELHPAVPGLRFRALLEHADIAHIRRTSTATATATR
jgi:pimeloyl-ACP methyl ester carboxylesterase